MSFHKPPFSYTLVISLSLIALTTIFGWFVLWPYSTITNLYENKRYHFQFAYPANVFVHEYLPHNDHEQGSVIVTNNDSVEGQSTVTYLTITLPFEKDLTRLPSARNLDDYSLEHYYNGFHTIVIHSSIPFNRQRTKALRQQYGAGEIVNGELREEGYDSALNGTRYVFWNGNSVFLIMRTNANSRILDQIAQTFSFTN
jgi:hypothetical protein